MQPPKYQPGDVLYLRESAAIGHLEAVTIGGLTFYNGKWVYAIKAGNLNPTPVAQYGDKISMVNGQLLQFSEEELIPICEALGLAETNAERNLEKIRAQRAGLCPDTTES